MGVCFCMSVCSLYSDADNLVGQLRKINAEKQLQGAKGSA